MRTSLGVAVVATVIAFGPAEGQAIKNARVAPPWNAFDSLPGGAISCTALPVSDDMKRGGIWQMLQLDRSRTGRWIVIGLDAAQRVKILNVLVPGLQPTTVQFDSTGRIDEQVAKFANVAADQRPAAEKLAAEVRRRCSPLPKIAGVGVAVPPAAHTDVLAAIEPNQPKCTNGTISEVGRATGIATSVSYSVRQPFRAFTVLATSKGEPRVFRAMVMWGASRPAERETVDAFFDDKGNAHGKKFLGYAGPNGTGASFDMTEPELAKSRTLALEILKRCAK